MDPETDPFALTELNLEENPTLPTGIAAGRGPPPERPRFGRFQVRSRIGSGGMGAVFLAWDPRLDRKVAIKVLLRAESEAGHERMLREAKAMARLSHPNIVPIYEVDVEGDEVFIVMEYVDGPTLRQWLCARRRSDREVLQMFIATCRGLEVAHAAGIVHRDFKPDNVLIGKDGRPRVADFGVVRFGDAHTGSGQSTALSRVSSLVSLTRSGALVGTPAYMSPEQFSGGEVTPSSDQFSLCVALWEALYHQRPFPGEDLYSLVDAVIHGRLRPPPATSKVPSRLRAALERGLATDPKDRWSSIGEFLGALKGPSALPGGMSSGAVRVIGAAVVISVLALGVAVALLMRSTSNVRRPTPVNPPASTTGEKNRSAPGLGTVLLEVEPQDAVVKVDGRRYAAGSPRQIGDLALGKHLIEVRHGDYLPYELSLSLDSTTPLRLPVRLHFKRVTLKVDVSPGEAVLSLIEDSRAMPVVLDRPAHELLRKPQTNYWIEAASPGYETTKVPLSFTGEPHQSLSLTLVRAADAEVEAAVDTETDKQRARRARPAPAVVEKTSFLKIGTGIGLGPAMVWVDGAKQSKLTPVIVKVAPGAHQVKWRWDDGKSSSIKVSIGDHESKVVRGFILE